MGCKQAAERTNDGCCLFVGLHVCTSTGFSEEKKKKATCVFSFTHIKSAKDLSGIEAFFWGLLFSSLAGQDFFKCPFVCESGLLNCLSAMLIFACGK